MISILNRLNLSGFTDVSHKFPKVAIRLLTYSRDIYKPENVILNYKTTVISKRTNFCKLGIFTNSSKNIQKRFLNIIAFPKGNLKTSSLMKGSSRSISQRRDFSFSRIAVRSPLGKRLLRLSKAVLKGIVIFYAVIFVILAVYFSVVNAYLNDYERINLFFGDTALPIDLAILLKLALYNELINKKFLIANEYYLVFLRYVNRSYGIPFEKDSETISEFPSHELIYSHGKQWYDLYVDILFRLGILKAQIGQLEECKCFLDKAISFIEFAENTGDANVGSPSLQNNGYRLLCKRASVLKEEKTVDFEKYYLKSIKAYYDGNEDISDDSVTFLNSVNSSTLNRDIYNSINELTTFYSKTDYKKSFHILVNNLIFLQSYKNADMNFPTLRSLLDSLLNNEDTSARPFVKELSDVPLIKLHISEILWKSKKYESAINWTKETFIEAYNYSRQDRDCAVISQLSINNLINMYRKLNKNGKYDEKIKRCEEVADDIYIPSQAPSSWRILFDDLL